MAQGGAAGCRRGAVAVWESLEDAGGSWQGRAPRSTSMWHTTHILVLQGCQKDCKQLQPITCGCQVPGPCAALTVCALHSPGTSHTACCSSVYTHIEGRVVCAAACEAACCFTRHLCAVSGWSASSLLMLIFGVPASGCSRRRDRPARQVTGRGLLHQEDQHSSGGWHLRVPGTAR